MTEFPVHHEQSIAPAWTGLPLFVLKWTVGAPIILIFAPVTSHHPGVVQWALCAVGLISAGLAYGLWRLGHHKDAYTVDIDARGVRVGCARRQYSAPWRCIERFSPGFSPTGNGRQPTLCPIVELTDGRTIPIDAMGVFYVDALGPGERAAMADQCSELESLRPAARIGSPAT